MTKMITIHPGVWKTEVKKYGFESSQLARQSIADYLGWDYIHILTSPQVRPDWKSDYEKIGFHRDSMFNICNYQSDIGHDELSVLPEEVVKDYPNAKLNLVNGYVASLENDGETLYFTSSLYLKKTVDDILEWYNKDGSLALRARMFKMNDDLIPLEIHENSYLYHKNNTWLTPEDLLIELLIDISSEEDLIIRDQHQFIRPKLWRYMENTNKKYYEIIHHNLTIDPMANLRKKTRYLTASEPLSEIVKMWGYRSQFMPPMVTKKHDDTVVTRKNPKSYCFVGNMSTNKRPELVVEAFGKLYEKGLDVEVTLYGGNIADIKERCEKITPNIHFAGYVDEVPYVKHDGYISASKSELFANACVEAMSHGLICLLSNTDIAHRYYAKQNSDVKVFNNAEELAELVERYYINDDIIDTTNTVNFVERYLLESVAERYKKLIK